MRNSAIAFAVAQARLDYSRPIEERDVDQETREAITDWQQLRDLDNLGRLAPQIERLILAWDDAWQPYLPGHYEVTLQVIRDGVRMAATGSGDLTAYYKLAAAIAEVYEDRRPQVYLDLFEGARMLIAGDCHG